jgi:hypothetical protein
MTGWTSPDVCYFKGAWVSGAAVRDVPENPQGVVKRLTEE